MLSKIKAYMGLQQHPGDPEKSEEVEDEREGTW